MVDFDRITVKKILTPRTVIKSVDENITVEQFYKKNEPITFSRIPVYKDNPDNITGFILKDEILVAVIQKKLEQKLSEFKKEIAVVFEIYPVHKLFKEMIDKNEQIVLVINGHGGMEGIVTLEDVLETLIGLEIVDETDRYKDMQILARKVWQEKTKENK